MGARAAIALGLTLSGLLWVSGCTKGENTASVERVVNLATWSSYVTPATIEAFQKKTGIKVQISNYSSNEELLAKLQAGASGWDVAVPSDYMVYAMVKLGLLVKLNYAELPNAKALDSQFLNKEYDSKNEYSLPWDWGTTGIAINRNKYSGEIKGWKDFFSREDLAGKVTLLDDAREAIGAALLSMGLDLNTTKPEDLQRAKALLLKFKPRLKAITTEVKTAIETGDIPVAHSYSTDTLQGARNTGGKVEYIIPEEGATLWIDNLVIPTGAKHLKEAHELINFMLDPAIAKVTVENLFVGPTHKGVFGVLKPELQTNAKLFPPPAVMSKLQMMHDLGESLVQWEKIWTEVKAQR